MSTTAAAPQPAPAGPTPASTLDAALAYAQLGWPVMPLYEPVAPGVCSCSKRDACGRDCGKHPRTAHGKSDATSDEATIREWWTRWPNSNIGIALPHPEFFVVDLDPRNGGDVTWAAICAEHEPLPPTVYQRTGSGGHHGLYRRHESVKLRSKIAPGVDIPTSYIVAAPSIHASGERYTWIRSPLDHKIAEPPVWLVELARVGVASRALPQRSVSSVTAEVHATAPDTDPSLDAWNRAVALMRSGATDAAVADALRPMASYQRRLAERKEPEAERWLDLTIGKARSSRAVVDPWAGAIQTFIVAAKYRHEGAKDWLGKAELHRVRLQLATEDGEILEPRRYVTLPLGGHHEEARKLFDATIGDLGPPEVWLTGERPRREASLVGRRLEVVMPAGPMRRAP